MPSDSVEHSRASMKPWMSRLIRVLAYILETLVALLAAAVGVTLTPWFHRALERQVVLRLEDLTGGRVEIHDMHLNPLILQITLHGLTLHGSESPLESPLFTAKTVVARLGLVPLARRKLRLRTLDWESAIIHPVTHPNGSTNFPEPAASLTPDQAVNELIDLSIGRLTLARTQIEWNDQRLPLEVDARYVAVLLRNLGAHRYAGSFSSSATRIRAPSWSPPPVTLSSQFELSRGTLNINSLAWQSAGFTGQGLATLRNPASPEGSFSFQTRAEARDLARSLGHDELRSGTIKLEGQGNYKQGEMTARGKLEARKLVLQLPSFSPGPVDLSAEYNTDLRHLQVSNLAVAALGGITRASVDASFGGASPQFVLRAQVHSLDMATALRSFPRGQPVLSRIPHTAKIDGTAEASWSGILENFKSQFDLQFHPPAAQIAGSFPVSGHAQGQAVMAPSFRLVLHNADFQTPQSRLSAQGPVDALQSNLPFQLVTSDFEEWRRLAEFLYGITQPIPLTFESPAVLSGTVAGTLAHPEIRGRLETGIFQYRGTRWDHLAADLVVAPDLIELSSGQLRGGRSTLTLNASAKLENWVLVSSSLVRLSAHAQKTPIELLSAALGPNDLLRGLASGHLDLEGTPANLTGAGVLRVEQGDLAQEPFDSISTNIRIAASTWNLEDVQVNKGSGRITGELRYDPTQGYFSAGFRGSDLSLAEFSHLSLPGSRPSQSPWLEGYSGFDLRGEGTLDAVHLHSRWSVQDLRVGGDVVGDLEGQIEWQGNKMRVEGESQGLGGILHFSGEVRNEVNWPLDLKGEYAGLHLEPWIGLLLNTKMNPVVSASGSFTASGPLKQPGRLEAQSQTQDLEIKFPGLTWKNEHPVELRYTAGMLTAKPFRLRGPSTDLEVEGSIRFGESGVLALNARGQAEAGLLSLIDPALQATGRSEVKLRLSAGLSAERAAQPLLNGTLDIRDVSLRYADLPFRISGLNGQIRLEGERATASSLRGASGGGSIALGGFVTLSQTPRFDLRANLDQIRVPYPRDFTSVLNGNLRLVGSSERGQLSGEFAVRQVFVNENFNLLARLFEGVNPLERRAQGIASPLASKVQLNIQVNSGAPLRLETPDWNLLADLDLSLQGTLASPVMSGTIHGRSGEASFRGNRYKLARGEIRMSNPLRTQPLLDLEASTRVQRYDLTVDISGPLDQLKLAYRSDPPLLTEDILSLLALGFSQQQREMATAPGKPLPAVQAGALLSQALSSQMTGRMQRLFGVSRIKVDPNVGGAGGPGGARVTFEQQVTRDLTLTYVTNTATSQYRIIQFEWAVSENTSLVGVRDQNGIFGVEVKFRKRFR